MTNLPPSPKAERSPLSPQPSSPTPLTRADIAREALAAAQQIENDWSRARAVRQMIKVLPADSLPAALELARALANPNFRARALLVIAAAVPAADQPALLAEAEQTIAVIAASATRAEPLSLLAARLSGPAQAEAAQAALDDAATIPDENERGWVILDLLPHLSSPAQLTALNHLRAIGETGIRATVLARAARHLPEADGLALLAGALAEARAIEDAEARARFLAGLLPTLPAAERAAVAAEALAAAAALRDEWQWARVLQWTADSLTPQARFEAYRVALALRSLGPRAEALGALALLADAAERPGRVAAALYAASQIRADWDRAFAIEPLAGALTPQQHPAALAAARSMRDAWARSDVLAELAATMPPDLKAKVLQEALAAARAAATPWARARALTTVAEKLD